ncbi:MAG: glycosyltransferase family 2 protein [Saprospiraceae bacterium]|nr:glycosyltransferase family 2 protein [Saprospiraceae bacterium]
MITPPVTVLMPVFNEHNDSLMVLIRDVLAAGCTLMIVDDGSDNKIVAEYPGLIILRHKVNLGQGAALETGMKYVRHKGIEILVHMDADGQHRVDELTKLIQPIMSGRADVVFGSRVLSKTSVSLIPWSRRWQLRISWCINMLFTGVWMSDVHNGFRAMNKEAIRRISLSVSGRGHASEIVYRVKSLNLNFCEIPVHVDYDKPYQENPLGLAKMLTLGGSLIWARLKRYKMKVPEKILFERKRCLKAAGINN